MLVVKQYVLDVHQERCLLMVDVLENVLQESILITLHYHALIVDLIV